MPKHQLTTQGGTRTAAIYSGGNTPGLGAAPGAVAVGSDVLLFSGRGLLATVTPHIPLTSGVSINFYDAVAPVSGGPLYASGHIPLFSVTGNANQTSASGMGLFPLMASKIDIGMPFSQGLCVNSRSGQVGFTVTFSPAKGE